VQVGPLDARPVPPGRGVVQAEEQPAAAGGDGRQGDPQQDQPGQLVGPPGQAGEQAVVGLPAGRQRSIM
jgi:hypothetical protein